MHRRVVQFYILERINKNDIFPSKKLLMRCGNHLLFYLFLLRFTKLTLSSPKPDDTLTILPEEDN
jgi:hypothetical protein